MSMKSALLCALATAFTAPFVASPTGDPFTIVCFFVVGAILAFGVVFALAKVQRFKELLQAKRWLAVGAVSFLVNLSLWLSIQIPFFLKYGHLAL